MIRYDERFTTKKIIKIRSWERTEDTTSVSYIPDSDLPECTNKIVILLDTVQGYEEYLDVFNVYDNKSPKTLVNVYGISPVIILESFEYFDALMESFLEKQQSNGKSDTKST